MQPDRVDVDAAGGGPGGLSARGAVRAVAAGERSATDILADARRQTARWEPWLGAVVELADERADGGRRSDDSGADLRGVVVGVKDLLWVRGMVRRCGAAELVDADPAPRDAETVRRLRDAGAAVLGTLELHQFAYGILTPQTRNPRAPERVAGGSSGGSAAAVAAGMAHVAVGTDTGGSIRIPAACCGVAGLKTTHGAIPLDGVQPLAPSLDTVGPLALHVADLALALAVLQGRDVVATPPPTLRVGVPSELAGMRIDTGIRRVSDGALEALTRAGASVTAVSLPTLPEAPRANGTILAAEALETHGDLLRSRPDGWWPDVRERLEAGTRLKPEWLDAAWSVRDRLRAELERAFRDVDVLLLPTLPCPVPDAGSPDAVIDGVAEDVTPAMTRLTSPWNLAGVPAGSLPAGRDDGGAPVGLQVVGPWDGEEAVLAAMALLERELGGPWPTAPVPA